MAVWFVPFCVALFKKQEFFDCCDSIALSLYVLLCSLALALFANENSVMFWRLLIGCHIYLFTESFLKGFLWKQLLEFCYLLDIGHMPFDMHLRALVLFGLKKKRVLLYKFSDWLLSLPQAKFNSWSSFIDHVKLLISNTETLHWPRTFLMHFPYSNDIWLYHCYHQWCGALFKQETLRNRYTFENYEENRGNTTTHLPFFESTAPCATRT